MSNCKSWESRWLRYVELHKIRNRQRPCFHPCSWSLCRPQDWAKMLVYIIWRGNFFSIQIMEEEYFFMFSCKYTPLPHLNTCKCFVFLFLFKTIVQLSHKMLFVCLFVHLFHISVVVCLFVFSPVPHLDCCFLARLFVCFVVFCLFCHLCHISMCCFGNFFNFPQCSSPVPLCSMWIR